jgi:hypothetical protein
MTVSSVKRVLAGLLLLFALSQALVVTKFPHFQTFDSWNECNYAGTCYEKVRPIVSVLLTTHVRQWLIVYTMHTYRSLRNAWTYRRDGRTCP